MNQGTAFLIFSAFAALVSVAMWIDYFRRIDVFEREKTGPLLVALAIGGLTPYLSLFVYSVFEKAHFVENGEFFHDLLYAILGIGVNEEFSKLLGVAVVFNILKKQINEPIDFLIYGGITALGFSMVENYYYFNNHGIKIITSRTFYSALEHIINTSIIVYGFYRKRLFQKGIHSRNVIVAVLLAVSSHGLFDFFLTASLPGNVMVFASLLIYLVGINFWIQMLNNANNYSAFFNYDKIHFSRRLVYRLLLWYLLTIAIAYVNNTIVAGAGFAFITFLYGMLSDGFLFFIVILRVSRFKFFKARYFKVRLGLPFYITKNNDEDFRVFSVPVKIRGENHREHLLTRFLDRSVRIYPARPSGSLIGAPVDVHIGGKYLLFDEVVVYSVTIATVKEESGVMYFLKPKMSGLKETDRNHQVLGLYKARVKNDGMAMLDIDFKKLEFIQWVYLIPGEELTNP